jgi:hypothetical protein
MLQFVSMLMVECLCMDWLFYKREKWDKSGRWCSGDGSSDA